MRRRSMRGRRHQQPTLFARAARQRRQTAGTLRYPAYCDLASRLHTTPVRSDHGSESRSTIASHKRNVGAVDAIHSQRARVPHRPLVPGSIRRGVPASNRAARRLDVVRWERGAIVAGTASVATPPAGQTHSAPPRWMPIATFEFSQADATIRSVATMRTLAAAGSAVASRDGANLRRRTRGVPRKVPRREMQRDATAFIRASMRDSSTRCRTEPSFKPCEPKKPRPWLARRQTSDGFAHAQAACSQAQGWGCRGIEMAWVASR
jgi:hypothetical protein